MCFFFFFESKVEVVWNSEFGHGNDFVCVKCVELVFRDLGINILYGIVGRICVFIYFWRLENSFRRYLFYL